jgi:hypothetical protein
MCWILLPLLHLISEVRRSNARPRERVGQDVPDRIWRLHPMFFTAKRALIEHGWILEAEEATT